MRKINEKKKVMKEEWQSARKEPIKMDAKTKEHLSDLL